MQVVILCGGRGERLKPLTDKVQKVMVDIHGRPFLDYVIRGFLREKFTKHFKSKIDILLFTGYKGEQIKNYYKDSMKYSEDNRLGTGGALKKAKDLLEDEFILANGDVFVNMDYNNFVEKFYQSGKMAMMAVYTRRKRNDVFIRDGQVLNYDKITRKNVNAVWVSRIIMNRKVLSLIPKGKSSLGDLFEKLIKDNQLGYYITHKPYDIGTIKKLEAFRKLYDN